MRGPENVHELPCTSPLMNSSVSVPLLLLLPVSSEQNCLLVLPSAPPVLPVVRGIKQGGDSHGTTLRLSQVKCRHAGGSRHPESAHRPMHFQTLDSGFRRNDEEIRGFCLKVVP